MIKEKICNEGEKETLKKLTEKQKMIGGLQRLLSEEDIVSHNLGDSINIVDRSLPLEVIHSFVDGEDASSDDSVIADEKIAEVEIADVEIADEN